jgi:hypothetical protein
VRKFFERENSSQAESRACSQPAAGTKTRFCEIYFDPASRAMTSESHRSQTAAAFIEAKCALLLRQVKKTALSLSHLPERECRAAANFT